MAEIVFENVSKHFETSDGKVEALNDVNLQIEKGDIYGIQDDVKAMILCNPSNPCGKVFTREELQIIADLAIKYDLYVITDEVYEHILYKPHEHVYLSTLPGMKEQTIICSSLSKTYSITGWRIGYVIASERITERVKKVHDFLTIGAAAPLLLRINSIILEGTGHIYTVPSSNNCSNFSNIFNIIRCVFQG